MQQSYSKILFLCLLIFTACKESEIQPLDFDEVLQKKYRKFIDDKLNNCKLKAIEEAEVGVDSLIDKLMSKDLIDTLNFPDKPIRPEKQFDEI